MIDLTIIIPVYNGEQLLTRCLDSVFGQTTHYTFEVICIDDGSSDGSVALIEGRKEQNITLLRQQNSGPSAARNRGVDAAKGRYCAFLDADDYWNDGFIEKTVSFLDSHNECVAVSVAQRHLTVSGEYVNPSCWENYDRPFILDDFFSFWADNMHVCTGSVTLRTQAVRQTGGMRQDLRITEDLEFWALMATYGRWGFIPEILFVSDGTQLVADKAHWLQKMQRRWDNAPTVAEWERRILSRMAETEAYRKARGRISRNLTYCQLLSERTALARQESLRYGAYFPKDPIGRLMNVAKHMHLTWWLLCKMLRYREWHRM